MVLADEMMTEIYSAEEFANCYSLRGYGKKKDALKWLERQEMQEATESDFQRCYHDLSDRMIRAHSTKFIAMRCDGQNISAPQNQPNSHGATFAAQMRQAQREIDATERWIRRKMEE